MSEDVRSAAERLLKEMVRRARLYKTIAPAGSGIQMHQLMQVQVRFSVSEADLVSELLALLASLVRGEGQQTQVETRVTDSWLRTVAKRLSGHVNDCACDWSRVLVPRHALQEVLDEAYRVIPVRGEGQEEHHANCEVTVATCTCEKEKEIGTRMDTPKVIGDDNRTAPTVAPDAIWSCKIGECDRALLPDGADGPLRQAVNDAYIELVGQVPQFIFSGWGAELTEPERAVVEERLPNPPSAPPDSPAGDAVGKPDATAPDVPSRQGISPALSSSPAITQALITAIQDRLIARSQPTYSDGTCNACGHVQPVLTSACTTIASGMAAEQWQCQKCRGQISVSFTIGHVGPSPDEDIASLLDILAALAFAEKG